MTSVLCFLVVQTVAVLPQTEETEIRQPTLACPVNKRPVPSEATDLPFPIRDPAKISWLAKDRFDPFEVRVESSHGMDSWDGPFGPPTDDPQPWPALSSEGHIVRPPRIPNTKYRPYSDRDRVPYRMYSPATSGAWDCTTCGDHPDPLFKPSKTDCGCQR